VFCQHQALKKNLKACYSKTQRSKLVYRIGYYSA